MSEFEKKSRPETALLHILKEEIVATQPEHHAVRLREPQNLGKPGTLQEVEIVGIPERSVILCADKMNSSLFREDDQFCCCHDRRKYRAKCDYIIIAEIENRNYIVYIEMKTTPRGKEHIPQLWGGRCFMEYLNFAMEHLEEIKPGSEYLHRFVKFCRIPEDKETTSVRGSCKAANKPGELNDRPGKAFSCCVTDGVPIALKELLYDFTQ